MNNLIRLSICLIVTGAMSTIFGQSTSRNVTEMWKTFAEKTEYKKTPRYRETIVFAKSLARESNLITYISIGKSSEGREIPLLIASSGRLFTPEGAKKSKKAIILVQAAIHSGESDGKDAGLALLRDIAITKTRKDLLDNAIILFVPIYNVDGHELFSKYNRINQNGPDQMGFRANSANQNLNRDYMKADTPETVAWLNMWNSWKPDFFIDCHVTDGADFRYNITYEFAHHGEVSPHLVGWMNRHFVDRVIPKVESEGNLLSQYLQFADRGDPTKGIFTFIATPRFATGYSPLRNRNGLLIEAHSLKPYRSRVRGTYDVLRYSIEEIGKNKESLFKVNSRADNETVSRGMRFDENFKYPLRQRIDRVSKPFKFKGVEIIFEDSQISGRKRVKYGTKAFDVSIPQFDSAKPIQTVAPPKAYIIPPQWRDIIKRLDYHGIRYSRLKRERAIEIESYRFENQKWASAPFEGRLTMSFKAIPIKETRVFPANSAVISLGQATDNVLVHWLEPNGPDSAMFWGFFNAIFEQKEYSESYIMEDIGRRMLETDEELRREFAEKLKDKKFANNPRARMNFLYRRSPYYDKRIGIYPVGRIINDVKFR